MSDSASERFRRADALFDAALDLPTEEHDAFVDRACDGDAALGAEVRRLLAAYRASGDFLENPSGEAVAPLASSAWELAMGAAPQRVGPFRIVREVGRGGMGTVFLAERDDGQFEQRVALKIVRALGRADTLIKRFLEERRILARLKHPHIAPLVDGGVLDDGTPWFAMDFVDGERLDAWCDARNLTISQRAVLFESVCEAVQYAHQQLVVHRDLKPSNILIAPDGDLKLLDFGIAKLLGDEDDETGAHTATMAMTPQYAAPEQLRGEPITAATDVYALGVVLYELLAGRRPYELRGQSPADVERLVCEVEPPRPSDTFEAPARGEIDDRAARASARGSTPDRLHRGLRGDLDAIVMQALQKEPTRRYQSAVALLDDLRRVQQGRPVSARAAGAMYRVRRFVVRHAAAITALVATLALLGGGLLRERTLRHRAEAAVRKARAVEDYMVSVFNVADPYAARTERDEDVSARMLLDRGVTRLERELEGEAELQSDLRGAFGRVYANLGLFDRAAEQARNALAQRRALRGQKHPEVAEALDILGDVLTRQNKFDDAEPLLREALAQRREFLGASDATTVTTLEHLGTLLQSRGSLPQADTIFREALAARRLLASTEKDSIAIASALNNLAVLLFVRGTYDEAESLDRESLAIAVRLVGENHPMTAMTVQNLAQVQQMRGQLDEAEALYRRALAAKRGALGDAHPSVTISMNNLGAFLERERGKGEEADSLFRAAIDLDRRIFGARHGYVAAGLNNLAGTERLRGHFDEAARLSREAISIAKDLYHEANKETAVYTNGLGVALHAMGDLTNATTTFRAALAEYRGSLGEKHLFTQTVAVNLARALYDRAEYQEADQLFRGVTAALDSSAASNRTMRAAAQLGAARVMTARGRARDAIPILERVVGTIREVSGANHWRTGEANLVLGEAFAAAGEPQRAESAFQEAVRILEPQAKAQPRLLAASRRALGRTATGKRPSA